MAAPSSSLQLWSQYLAARLGEMVLSMFPTQVNLRTARSVGRLLHQVDRRHRERAQRHLRLAMPELSDAQRDDIALRSFEHLIELAIEVTMSPRLIGPTTWPQRIRVRSLGPALQQLNAHQPSLMLTGHLGNWEVLGACLASLGYDVDAIARPLDNPRINDWLMKIRSKRGLRIITKFNASDQMMQVLDRRGTLAFIADQNAGDRGMFVPFFGRLASTYKSIGLLALRSEVPIICGYAHRVGHQFQFEVGVDDVIHPDDWRGRDDPLYYITARFMRSIEHMIRRAPEQYLWMHRRWKSRPRYEREGKPMPASLRRNLESLPWIDQTMVEQLAQPLDPDL